MIRLWLARLSRPLRWRSPHRTARMLLAFAEVERSSFVDMMAAANRTADPHRCAQYLRHATDERRHADAFAARALALDPGLATHPALYRIAFEDLYDRLGEARFLAFVHHGERRGRAQMAMYCAELAALEGTPRADPQTRALFEAIVADEERHERYTGELVAATGASVAGAVAWELWRDWRRMGSALAGGAFAVGMATLYLLLAPIAWLEQRNARRDPEA